MTVGRYAQLAGTGIALIAIVLAPAIPAHADPRSTCDGVTVVVDFGPLGGGVQTGCAPGSPRSGLEALSAAGFSFAFVPRQPGMVCRVAERPDPCNGAPAEAYWGYWHARPGGAWTYSDQGAATYVPPVGGVEGWAFGAGRRPDIAPPAQPAPPVLPAPSAASGPGAGSDPGAANLPGGTASSAPITDQQAPGATEVPVGGASSAAPTVTPSGSSAYQSTLEVKPLRSSSRAWWSWGIGLSLIAGLTGLAVGRARKRRG